MRLRWAPRIALPRDPLRDGETALRPWHAEDADTLVALCRDPGIRRWIRVSESYGPADARAYIEDCEPAARAGLAAGFAIADGATDTPLGSISLVRFAWPERRAEVGYWLGADARGHGHATRAVGLITRWGFRELGLERIALLAAVENPASQAVAVRAGFTREALFRGYDDGPDARKDIVCFARLVTDVD